LIREAPAAARASDTPPGGPLIAPSPEVLERLADLLDRGRIPELGEALTDLEADRALAPEWVA
jgi:hypothetical protein